MRSSVSGAACLLLALAPGAVAQHEDQPRPLSRFESQKAEQLLATRYPCLGCHTLNGRGGRVGPTLAGIGTRRSPEFVARMVADPQGTVPGTIMPRVPMPPDTRALIVGYLIQQTGETASNDAVPLAPAPGEAPPADAPALYGRYCAVCHGAAGNGDGPNAQFLAVRPAALASPDAMAERPDDTLFDTIAAGGYVMNRSNFMPPFGETLTREQIWSLVRYVRTLCGCEGPSWSRDNR
jgi:mono/diheme cytochrome c family protein